MAEEQTKKQTTVTSIFVSPSGREEYQQRSSYTYAKRREVRKDPTIALGRAYSVAPILTSPWTVQSAGDEISDERVKFIKDQINPWRLEYLMHALYGGIDFGWAPFEVVFGEKNGKIVLEKLKPLLQDITIILIDRFGNFVGFKQKDNVVVEGENALLVSFRVEGSMLHGQPLLDNVVRAFDSWNDAENGAKRYDKKIAGSHFIIYYPPGNCLDAAGETVSNATMAGTILDALEASGSIAVPRTILEHIEELNDSQKEPYEWKIELLSDKAGKQGNFVTRLRYLDTIKIRGMLMPERTMIEGSHGTLAESTEHMNLALTQMDFLQLFVSGILNRKVIDVLLVQNWGEDAAGSVWVTPTSLVDTRKAYLQKVYMAIISKMGDDMEVSQVDMDALKDLIGVPKTSAVTRNPANVNKRDTDKENKKVEKDKKEPDEK